jgi:hypothetical protein
MEHLMVLPLFLLAIFTRVMQCAQTKSADSSRLVPAPLWPGLHRVGSAQAIGDAGPRSARTPTGGPRDVEGFGE